MTGEGSLDDATHTSFGFEVRSTRSGPEGRIRVHSGAHTFAARSISSLAIDGHTATFTGTGSWDGFPGFTFAVRIVDAGRSDSEHRDRFAITIRDPQGATVFGADWPLRRGDIAINGGRDKDHDEDGEARRPRSMVTRWPILE